MIATHLNRYCDKNVKVVDYFLLNKDVPVICSLDCGDISIYFHLLRRVCAASYDNDYYNGIRKHPKCAIIIFSKAYLQIYARLCL